jgi:hypothetical protein
MSIQQPKINCQINADITNLTYYNIFYKWIPNSEQIRPSEECNENKIELNSTIEMYTSIVDYVAVNIFKLKPKLDRSSGLISSKVELFSNKINKFIPNEFRYQTSEGFHYVMWYSYTDVPEKEINNDIFESIKNITNNEKFYFVWYINPTMSVPEVFHVQVFWNTY